MLPDPTDVRVQRLGQLVGAGLKAGRVIEENKVQPPQRLGHCAVIGAPADDGREALVERRRMRDLLERHLGRHRLGRQHEHYSVSARN